MWIKFPSVVPASHNAQEKAKLLFKLLNSSQYGFFAGCARMAADSGVSKKPPYLKSVTYILQL